MAKADTVCWLICKISTAGFSSFLASRSCENVILCNGSFGVVGIYIVLGLCRVGFHCGSLL